MHFRSFAHFLNVSTCWYVIVGCIRVKLVVILKSCSVFGYTCHPHMFHIDRNACVLSHGIDLDAHCSVVIGSGTFFTHCSTATFPHIVWSILAAHFSKSILRRFFCHTCFAFCAAHHPLFQGLQFFNHIQGACHFENPKHFKVYSFTGHTLKIYQS